MSEQAVINRLDDILEQTEYIISAVSGITFEEFISNPLCSAGVIRFFEIIGEAARNILLHPCADDYPEIPWKKLVGLRNVLIHEYPAVDLEMIWHFAVNQIPVLHNDIVRMRESLISE
ncbi:MAG TPA: DUF86 domain-containing protein [Methanocorpusculum sp.]|nr:DUF86 domain-containing protein [Methanocorpusculum sp.]HJJ46554.1 DUF86 domain-containing protein [Methanocorpusculum sp.]